MSDPIALHSKPLSNPLDSSAANQPAAAGQFQQFSTQPHDSTNRMPVRTDDTGKQSPLPERNIRQPIKDEFLSNQETMIKASQQLLENNQQSLQAHKDRLHSLGIDSLVTPIIQKPTLANTTESPPKTGMHDAIKSDQAVSVSSAAPVTGQAAQDNITETSVSSAKGDSEQHTEAVRSGTFTITARATGTANAPDTRVTTTSIVTKTVTTTTTETLHDQPATPTLRETLAESTSAPTDRLKTIPGLGEIPPAADHFSEPTSRRTSFDTAKRESLSSTESADFQIASSVVVDPNTMLSPGRSREIIIAHGEKQKLYNRIKVPENSTVRDLQEQIENEVTSFRRDKRRSKMLIEISSCYKKEDGKEETLYASYEGARQGIVKRQARPAAAEIASTLSTILVEKEQKADQKINQLQNGLPEDEKPGDGQTIGEPEQSKNEQTMGEPTKNEQTMGEPTKNEQTMKDNSDQPS